MLGDRTGLFGRSVAMTAGYQAGLAKIQKREGYWEYEGKR